jgi:hypothetical protein
MATRSPRPRNDDPPDLQTQLEAMLDAVWTAEDDWRLDDRIELSLAVERYRLERQ